MDPDETERLTPREQEIAGMLLAGLSNKEMAGTGNDSIHQSNHFL